MRRESCEHQMDDSELDKFVDYAYRTPSGGILHLKNGAAIILRNNGAKILPSLEEYHAKYKDDSSTWNELTNDEDKKNLYDANAAALTKIKRTEIETVVEAAQKRDAAEKRKSLIESFRKALNDLLSFIIFVPFVVLIIWGANYGAERYFGTQLWHLQNGFIAALATTVMLNCTPKNPGRGAVISGAIGYLIVALIYWKFG
jgi:hypothetical protein